MAMVWRETYPYIGLLLSDVYSTEHNAFDKAVHGEFFNFCILEQGSFDFIGHHKSRGIKEESEVVSTKGVAGHTVYLEVLQILY